MELPSDLFHPPLASFIEGDYSRHHCLHMLAEGCGDQAVGNGRGILSASVGSFRLWVSLFEYATASSANCGDGRRNQTEN